MFSGLRAALRMAIFGILLILSFGTASAQGPIEPLLQKYCLGCHNEANPEVGLSLQTPESLKRGSENGSILNAADPMQSLLYQVLAKDSDKSMPPQDEAQPSDAERELLRQWVLAGASIKSMAAGIPDVPSVKPFGKVDASVLACAATPDGKLIAIGGQRFVSLMDASNGKSIWKIEVPLGKVLSLAFAKNNLWIVAAVGMPGVTGKSLLINQVDGTIIREFGSHSDAVYSAVLNDAGSILASAGYDRRIVLHDVETGNVLRAMDGHNGSVFSLAFNPNGNVLCSASADGTVKVWNLKSGERLDTLSQPQSEQYSVVLSNDGQRIFAAGADNRIRTWQLLSMDKPRINPLLEAIFAHEQPITRVAISPGGSLLASCAEDGTLRVWSTSPLQNVQTLPQQSVPVMSLSFVGDSQLFVGHLNGDTQLLAVNPSFPTADKGEPTVAAMKSPDAATALPAKLIAVAEVEGNDAADVAQQITLPARVTGLIQPAEGKASDVDCFRFAASAGQPLLLEVLAARDKSPLDSRIEIVTPDGQQVLQTRLQAVRDSYFTFRGKDSDTSDDFRVFNWQEMELNEYLYSDGEVVKLWLYPRGPDSGFQVYPGFGKRFTFFGTTPTSHALQAPCFIVVPLAADEPVVANGLPVFPIYYENDDDSLREFGSDSRLHFVAPADGEYVVRVSDARGFGGDTYKYQLDIRQPQPSFEVSLNTKKLSVHEGTGQEIMFTAKRIDGYEGPIVIDVNSMPDGFGFSGPIVIEEGQMRGFATVFAKRGAIQPTEDQVKAIRFVASADSVGEKVLAGINELKLTADPKIRVTVLTADVAGQDATATTATDAGQVVLQIRPGQTIQALAKIERLKHDGIISFGKEDSGRNLPHGVYVDNIGLNGLLLLEGQSDRDFFVTAARWVKPSTTTFFLKSNIDGITTLPVTLEVLPAESSDLSEVTADRN